MNLLINWGVKALDNETLQIKLEKPTPYFIKMLGIGYASPVSEKTVNSGAMKLSSQNTYFQMERLS